MSRSIVPVIALVVLGAPAYAQDPPSSHQPSGIFVKGSALAVFPLNAGLDDHTGTLTPPVDLTYDTGFGLMVGLGYTFDAPESPWKLTVDCEYAFRRSDFNQVETGAGDFNVGGNLDVHAIMFDLVMDFELVGPFGAYVGAGLGPAISDASSGQVDTVPAIPFSGDDKVTFAWQVTWGIKYTIADHFVVYLGGRYFDAGNLGFPDADFDYRDLGIEVGVRFYF